MLFRVLLYINIKQIHFYVWLHSIALLSKCSSEPGEEGRGGVRAEAELRIVQVGEAVPRHQIQPDTNMGNLRVRWHHGDY